MTWPAPCPASRWAGGLGLSRGGTGGRHPGRRLLLRKLGSAPPCTLYTPAAQLVIRSSTGPCSPALQDDVSIALVDGQDALLGSYHTCAGCVAAGMPAHCTMHRPLRPRTPAAHLPTTCHAARAPPARSEIRTYAGETFQKEGIALHLGAR